MRAHRFSWSGRGLTTVVLSLLASVALVLGTATTGGAVVSPADTAAAEAGLIVASDLGAGWTQTPYKSSDSSTGSLKKIGSCRHLGQVLTLLDGKKVKNAKGQSPNFKQAGITVNNSTIVLPDEQLTQRAMAAVASPDFAGCFRDLGNVEAAKVKKNPKIAKEVASTSVSVAPINSSLSADQEAGIRLIFTLHTKSGAAVSSGVVLDLVRVGRALDAYTIEYDPSATQAFAGSTLVASVQRLRSAMQAAG